MILDWGDFSVCLELHWPFKKNKIKKKINLDITSLTVASCIKISKLTECSISLLHMQSKMRKK